MAIHDVLLLHDVAEGGYQEAIICLATIAISERANRPSLIEAVNTNGAGYAARILRDGALFRMHMYVVAAYDKLRYPDDINLRAAIEFIERSPHLASEMPRADVRLLNEAARLFRISETNAALAPLIQLRHKAMAHRGVLDPMISLPMYQDLYEFTRDTCRVWELLALGAGCRLKPMREREQEQELSAEALWSKLEAH